MNSLHIVVEPLEATNENPYSSLIGLQRGDFVKAIFMDGNVRIFESNTCVDLHSRIKNGQASVWTATLGENGAVSGIEDRTQEYIKKDGITEDMLTSAEKVVFTVFNSQYSDSKIIKGWPY